MQKHAPLKVVSKRKIKQLAKPWITKGIRTSIKIKNRLYKTGNCREYKSYRNKIITLTRLSKSNITSIFFNENVKNIKKTWQGINELLNNRNKHHKTITTLKDPNSNNQVTNDPSRIPYILNEHFASVGTKLASKLPTKSNHMDYLKKLKSPDSSFFPNRFPQMTLNKKFYHYQTTNRMVYTLVLPNFLNVRAIFYLLSFRTSSILLLRLVFKF